MASVIGGGMRKPPRIMSRKGNLAKRAKSEFNNGRDNEAEKLRNQGFEIQSGVLTINPSHPSNFQPKQLPGVANEIESYPCRFCEHRVFLTAAGLEKHGSEQHPENITEIRNDVHSISTEWRKRDLEHVRCKQRQMMERMRHEAKAQEMIRHAINGVEPVVGTERYEACEICNVLINIMHPTAMDSHQRAHKKNDELKMQMLDEYGPEIVERLTCDSCSLVFTDESKLRRHIEQHHTRKKKYICKYCGTISHTLTELNLHKSDVHNVFLPARIHMTSDRWTVVPDQMQSRRQYLRFDGETVRRTRKRAAHEMASTSTANQTERTNAVEMPVIGQVADGDIPCKICCPDCGLKLNRPATLVRHMRRVHSKMTFSCVAESGGLPSFGIDVEETGVFWTCCSARYSNRREFVEHRKMHIPNMDQLGEVGGEEEEEEEEEEEGTSTEHHHFENGQQIDEENTNFEGELVQGPDGTMQVIIPEGMEINGDVFVVFGEDGTNPKVRIVRASNNRNIEEEVEQQMIEDVGGEQQMMSQDDEGRQVVTMTQEQYEQYQMQMGDDLYNVDIMLVNNDEVLEDEHLHDVVEEVVVGDEEEEGEEQNGTDIHGTPLFD